MPDQLDPMSVANQFVSAKARAKQYDKWSKECNAEASRLEASMLKLIEDGKLPESFKIGKATVFTSEELWASAKDKDHERLADVLRSHGMTELLPRTVNSQSLSAWVREFRNDFGEVVIADDEHPEGMPREVADALNISQPTRVKVNGL